jgi:chloramphenicol-sensitive protein RarD
MKVDNKGLAYAFGAYFIWGLFPLYWKLLKHVPAVQLIGHRIVWSFLLLLTMLLVLREWKEFRAQAFQPKVLMIYLVASLLIGVNWLTYVWAVNAGFIVETSLGYFINPLLSVIFGMIFLGERLRPLQWIPVALAAIGVGYLTVLYGRLPWIALALAFSFGLYGLVKKLSPLRSLPGLVLETGLLFPFAVVYLGAMEFSGSGSFLHTGTTSDLLMIGAGLVTTVPLLLFVAAAQRIPLTLVGLIQYMTPTLQLMLGVFVFHEPFSQQQLIGFSIVWVGLVFFWVEGFVASRRAKV